MSISDEEYLNLIFQKRYGDMKECSSCKVEHPKYYWVTGTRRFACENCKFEVDPCLGTIFEYSHTSPSKWYAMMRMVQEDQHISSALLAKKIGVGQKAAWRMKRQFQESNGDIEFPAKKQRNTVIVGVNLMTGTEYRRICDSGDPKYLKVYTEGSYRNGVKRAVRANVQILRPKLVDYKNDGIIQGVEKSHVAHKTMPTRQEIDLIVKGHVSTKAFLDYEGFLDKLMELIV